MAETELWWVLRGWSQVIFVEKTGISTIFLEDIETEKSWVSPFTL